MPEPQQGDKGLTAAAVLAERVLLICPTLSFWQGQYQLPKEQVQVHFQTRGADAEDTILDDESITRTKVNLLTEKWPTAGSPDGTPWKKLFGKLRSRQATIVNKYSTGFPDMPGVRLVPKVAGVGLFRELDAVKADLNTLADQFCDALDQIKAELGNKLDAKVWAAIRNKIPATREKMRLKFNSAALPIEISGQESSILTMSELQEFRGTIKAQIDSRVEAAVEEMIGAPRRELAAAIDALVELLSQESRVTDRSFNAVRQAMQKLRHFSFAAPPELLQRMNQVEESIRSSDPATLRSSPDSRVRLAAAISGITEELRDSTKLSIQIAAISNRSRRVAV